MNLDLRRRRENITVIHIRHADDQFEVAVFQLGKRLLLRRHLREPGRIAKAERSIFIEYLLVHTTVVFQHEGIVFCCNKQYIIYTLIH